MAFICIVASSLRRLSPQTQTSCLIC